MRWPVKGCQSALKYFVPESEAFARFEAAGARVLLLRDQLLPDDRTGLHR
jgi:hypothetical protein